MRSDFGLVRIPLLTFGKSANVWEWASHVNASPYERLICERLAGLREIVMGPCLIGHCGVPSPTRSFAKKEFDRDHDGVWVDETPDRNNTGIDAVRNAVMDDVLCKA